MQIKVFRNDRHIKPHMGLFKLLKLLIDRPKYYRFVGWVEKNKSHLEIDP